MKMLRPCVRMRMCRVRPSRRPSGALCARRGSISPRFKKKISGRGGKAAGCFGRLRAIITRTVVWSEDSRTYLTE